MKRIELRVEGFGGCCVASITRNGRHKFMATGETRRQAVEDVCAVFRNWMWEVSDRVREENEHMGDVR